MATTLLSPGGTVVNRDRVEEAGRHVRGNVAAPADNRSVAPLSKAVTVPGPHGDDVAEPGGNIGLAVRGISWLQRAGALQGNGKLGRQL